MAIRLFAIVLILDLCISTWCHGEELASPNACCGSTPAATASSLDRIVVVDGAEMSAGDLGPTWIASPTMTMLATEQPVHAQEQGSRIDSVDTGSSGPIAAAVMTVTPLFRDADPWMDGWNARVQLLDARGRPAMPSGSRVRANFRLIRDFAIDRTDTRFGASRGSSGIRDDAAPRWSKTLSFDRRGIAHVELATRSDDRVWLGLERRRDGRHRSVFDDPSARGNIAASSGRTLARRFVDGRWNHRRWDPPANIVAIGDGGAIVELPPLWGGVHATVHVSGRGSFEAVDPALLREAVLVDTPRRHP